MTHHTEQERAECRKAFEFELIDNHQYVPSDFVRDGDYYADDDTQFAWELAWSSWQAARRAPVAPVPQGWTLKGYEDGSITVQAPSGERWRYQETPGTGTGSEFIYSLLKAMLAAAPQPPEAAPVQMPEPVAFVHTPAFVWNGNISPVVSFAKYEDDYKSGIYSLRTPLYTEQQVRELLAAHGIGGAE